MGISVARKLDSRIPAPLRSFDERHLEDFLAGAIHQSVRPLPALSMFSNAGIGDFGYRIGGFTFHAHAELRPERLEIGKLNHPRSRCVPGDLRETWRPLIEAWKARWGKVRPALLTGMSPCQGMSSASAWARKGEKGPSEDPRNSLPFLLSDVAAALKPRVVVVENVPAIMTTRIVDPQTAEEGFVAELLAKRLPDYVSYPATIQFADYGVPQRRRRALFTFIHKAERCNNQLRQAETVPYPRRTHDVTARLGLRPWTSVESFMANRYPSLDSSSAVLARDERDLLHYVPVYDASRYELVRAITPRSGKSAYETDDCPHCQASPQPREDAVCFNCRAPLHTRPIVQDENGSWRLISGHRTSYKRMPAHLPASTITTANGHLGSDTKIHPWEHRLLSPRESADLQTIPRSFVWSAKSGGVPHNEVLRAVIGEAIPPWFTYLHGLALYSLLHGGLCAPALMPASDVAVEVDPELGAAERKRARRRRLHCFSGKARRQRARTTNS